MANIAKIRLNGTNYNIKDNTARNNISGLQNNSNLEFYGIIRPTANGWIVLDDADHKPKNLTAVEVSGQRLKITHNVGATHIGSVVVSPDESFASINLCAGASVNLDDSYIDLYMSPICAGRLQGTGTALSGVPGYTCNIGTVSWDVNHWLVTLPDHLKRIATVVGGQVQKVTGNTDNDTLEYLTNLDDGGIFIYPWDPVAHDYATPTGTVKLDVTINVSTVIDPQKMVDYYSLYSGFNIWIYGQMHD